MILVPKTIGKVHGGTAASVFTQVKLCAFVIQLVYRFDPHKHRTLSSGLPNLIGNMKQ